MISFLQFLTKREVKRLNAGIKKFDLKSPVFYLTLLSDELIETRLPNFAGAVRGSVYAAIFAGNRAIQPYDKAYWLGFLRRS